MCLSKRTCFRMTHGRRGPFVMGDPTVSIEILKASFGVGYHPSGDFTRAALVRNRIRMGSGSSGKEVALLPKRGTILGEMAKQVRMGRISPGVRVI